MFIPPFLQRYLLLNAIRLLTITSCTLVISSTIRLLVLNFQHYPPPPSTSLTLLPSSYYPGTDIPTTFLGVFWSTLHHVSISLVLFVVILSELSLPIPLLHRLFKNTLPFLGPNWGTGFLGVLLVLVAGDGLSRGNAGGRFKEVSDWLMAAVGVMNVAAGVVWKAKGKVVRGWGGWKLEVAKKLEGLAEAKAKAEKVGDAIPLPASMKQREKGADGGGGLKGMFSKATGMVAKKLDEKQQQKEARAAEKQAKPPVDGRDLEKEPTREHPSQSAPQPMHIFTPALPSAVVQSRPPPSSPSPRSSLSSTSTISRTPPTNASQGLAPTRIPPPPLLLHRPPSTTTTSSRSSCYSLHPPPPPPLLLPPAAFSSPHNPTSLDSQHSQALSPLQPPPPARAPMVKQVRFNSPTHRTLSTTIDSHCAEVRGGAENRGAADSGGEADLRGSPEFKSIADNRRRAENIGTAEFRSAVDIRSRAENAAAADSRSIAENRVKAEKEEVAEVNGSKFLMLPTPTNGDNVGLLDGERSPSVLASLKAAMLEAKAKAAANKNKKSIYLGSNRWLAEYTGSTTSPPYGSDKKGEEKEEERGNEEKSRPYNFL